MSDSKLAQISDADLLAELERRQQAKQKPPEPLAKPDFTDLETTVKSCVANAVRQNLWDEDNDHYIFEAAMEAVYGKDYWTWHNTRFR